MNVQATVKAIPRSVCCSGRPAGISESGKAAPHHSGLEPKSHRNAAHELGVYY
jgi:hypothetical protein